MAASDLPLSDDDRATLSMRSDEFHVALARGAADDWTQFLEGLTGDVRLAVLIELAIVELGHRYEAGEQPTLEDYTDRFPELGPPGDEPAALVVEYERCREKFGFAAKATQYSKRIPTPAIQDDGTDDAAKVTRTVRATGRPSIAAGVGGGFGGEALLAVDQQYELIRELGRGAFGEVWLAKKMPSGIEKAVKILHQPADQEISQRELESLELIKNLRHPYLLATEDFWIANNRLYIVTELADMSLRKRLVECKDEGLPGVPIDELFTYIHESADGFDFLHSKMITHRDVKPDNILIVNGHAKVADFGLARASQANVAAMSFAGTPAYMAPEVWGGEGGPPSDLYGFAMSYIELRQGTTPFKMGKVMEVMQAHLSGNFEFAEFVEEPEREVLRRALSKDPQDRHPSCLAFVEDLADALGRHIHRKSGSVPVPRRRLPSVDPLQSNVDTGKPFATVRNDPSTLDEAPPKPPFSKKAIAGIGVAVVLLLSLGVYLMIGGQRDLGTPPGTIPEQGETLQVAGRGKVPVWVVADRNGEKVRFRLIAPDGGTPFYISQSKVWNSLYGKATQPGGPDAPAMNATANEAASFAESFGGRLPTPAEWDFAAGLHNRAGLEGPLQASGKTHLDVAEPGPTHGEGTDKSQNQFGLIDMASNGREWTSAVLLARAQPWNVVEGAGFDPKALVVLRGRNFTLKKPLTYKILEGEVHDPQTQFAGVRSPYTGFRIVLQLR